MKHTSKRPKRTSTPGDRVAYTLTGYHERLLLQISEILWPADDPDQQWEVDTIEHVANVLDRNGFGRRKR